MFCVLGAREGFVAGGECSGPEATKDVSAVELSLERSERDSETRFETGKCSAGGSFEGG